MNEGFKQRIVGAIVLISVALILWPVLFSDAAGPLVDRRSQIPPVPKFEKFSVAEPVRPVGIKPVPETTLETEEPVDLAPMSVEQKPLPKTADTLTTAAAKALAQKPTLGSRGLPEGWLLQVASFGNGNNAEDLKAKLQRQGYKAFTRTIKTAGGEVVRVYIGPKLTKDAFDKDRPSIDKTYKVKSIVVKFEQ